MLPRLSPTEWISIASFSLSLGALLSRFFFKSPSAKAHLSTAILLLAFVSIFVNLIQSRVYAKEIRILSDKVYLHIGNQEKTIDQLLIELNYPNTKLFSSAFELLAQEEKIESNTLYVNLNGRENIPIKLWRASTPNNH